MLRILFRTPKTPSWLASASFPDIELSSLHENPLPWKLGMALAEHLHRGILFSPGRRVLPEAPLAVHGVWGMAPTSVLHFVYTNALLAKFVFEKNGDGIF